MDERERKYLSMVEACPESGLGYFTLGKYYLEVGRFDEAIVALERCLSEDPAWTAALVALADARAAKGDRQQAIALLERALAAPLHPLQLETVGARLAQLKS